jgi:tetratricopeptide (TPR) repeat protein
MLLVPAVLATATIAVYARVRGFEFVTYDDLEFVAENPALASGLTWQAVRWSWANAYDATGGPLTWLSHLIDVELFGFDAGGHHLTNLALHVANTLLLHGVLLLMTGRLWPSAVVAALFAVHPLHVESVAWVAQRKDVLSTFFWLLATWAYVSYTRRPRPGAYAMVTVWLAMGLLSKPMVATLPFVLLLLDVWPLRRVAAGAIRRLLIEKLPWIAMSIASLAFTFASQQRGGSLAALDQLPFRARLANAVVSYALYLVKVVWPANLTPHYPYDPALSAPLVLACLVLLLAITAASIRLRDRLPAALVGWAWYLGTLVPVIGFVQVGTHARADRFTYVPSIGLFVLMVWGGAALMARWRVPRSAAAAAAAVVLFMLGVAAHRQVGVWRDGLSLWQHAVRVSPQDHRAHLNLGVTLSRARRFDEAILAYRQAIRLAPEVPEAYNNLGLALKETGNPSGAIGALDEALRRNPGYAAARANRANLRADAGDLEGAISDYEQAILLDPDVGLVRINLAVTLAQIGRLESALEQARAAVALEPARAEWRFVTAMIMKETGRRDDAIRELKAVLAIDANHAHARRELADLCPSACG